MNRMPFVHLRTHTEYSVVDGTLRIDEAVATAAAMEDGPHGRPSGGSGWFFAATLVQHVRWYQQQVGALLASFPVFFFAGGWQYAVPVVGPLAPTSSCV